MNVERLVVAIQRAEARLVKLHARTEAQRTTANMTAENFARGEVRGLRQALFLVAGDAQARSLLAA